MKTIGNLAGVAVGIFLVGAVLVAQDNYQRSFGGTTPASVSVDTPSIAGYQGNYVTVALK